MIDADAITTVISNLGFPIAVSIYMMYVNQKQTQSHKEEVTKMTEAITELKLAINSLIEKIAN